MFSYHGTYGWSDIPHQYEWTWLAGASAKPGRVPTIRQVDSAAAIDGGARFAVCFMLAVSCALWRSLLSMIALYAGLYGICASQHVPSKENGDSWGSFKMTERYW